MTEKSELIDSEGVYYTSVAKASQRTAVNLGGAFDASFISQALEGLRMQSEEIELLPDSDTAIQLEVDIEA